MSRIPSQKMLPSTTAHVSRVLYFTCMKNSTTSVALNTAIVSAAIVLSGPRSKYATCQVRYVHNISTVKMT